MTTHPKKALLALLIPALMCHTAQANTEEVIEPQVELEHEVINISAKPKEQVGETIVTRRELNEQMVQNAHDLVRYNTEVDVAEVGRYGNKGFAIRGVDGNRVAMSIDGVALPDVEVNEIYSPYGYMYEGRLNPDLEMMGRINITAGADSLTSGSGAVGGAVSYMTKEPISMIKDGNLGGYAKVGYTDKNEEVLTAVGLAGVWDKFEFMVNYAERHGHETKNHAMRDADNARLDPSYILTAEEVPATQYGYSRSLIYPNPMDYERRSVLGKIFYNIDDNHRIGLHTLYQNQDSHINVESADVISGERFGRTTRRAHDRERLHNYGLEYQYQFNNDVLDRAKFNYTYSEVLGLADTWLYSRSFLRTCPADPSLSWWRCPVDTVYELQSSDLSERKYRPAETKTNQYSFSLNSLPLNFGKFGEHKFDLKTNYTKQDYTISAVAINYMYGNYFDDVFPDTKKDIYNITLSDNIYFNDRLNAQLGLRYDTYHYKPYFQTDIVISGKNEFERSLANCGWSGTLYCQNHRAGKGLTNTKFNHFTYSGGLKYTILPEKLDVRYKISTGFLAPTATQIYSQFQGLGARQVPNYDLKPEKSLNQELEFEYKPTTNTNLTFGGYHIDYKDFIHTRYWRGSDANGCQTNPDLTCMQSQNLDKAKVYGFKFGVESNVSDKLNLDGQLKLSANFHTSKDSAEIQTDKNGTQKINTLASVPMSWILGASYLSADGTWDLNAKLRFINHKDAKDTKTLETDYNTVQKVCRTGYENMTCYYGIPGVTTYQDREYYEEVRTFKHINHSKTVALIDVYGSKKFGANKNWILNAGVYNLTNVNYMPWETLRQFNNTSANLMFDSTGYGLNRYTAPGRNYALSLTYEF